MIDQHTGITQLRELTGIFYRRVWTSRNLIKCETVLWTFAAIYLGFMTFNYTLWVDSFSFWMIPYYGIVVSSPFVIGWMVRKTRRERGEVSELVSTTTIKPFTYVFANWLSVVISVIRLYLPLGLIFAISHFLQYRFYEVYPEWTWSTSAILQLVDQPYSGLTRALRAGHGWHAWDVIGSLWVCQVIGWFSLPVSWGLWVETRLKNISRYYGVFYFSFLFIPLINLGMSYFLRSNISPNQGLLGSLPGNTAMVSYIGLSSLVISVVVLVVTIVNTGRRDK